MLSYCMRQMTQLYPLLLSTVLFIFHYQLPWHCYIYCCHWSPRRGYCDLKCIKQKNVYRVCNISSFVLDTNRRKWLVCSLVNCKHVYVLKFNYIMRRKHFIIPHILIPWCLWKAWNCKYCLQPKQNHHKTCK